jgi:hypothetical protein
MAIRIPGFEPERSARELPGGNWLVKVTPAAIARAPAQELELTAEQFHRYCLWCEGRGLIQELLPDLTNAQREILQTGLVL